MVKDLKQDVVDLPLVAGLTQLVDAEDVCRQLGTWGNEVEQGKRVTFPIFVGEDTMESCPSMLAIDPSSNLTTPQTAAFSLENAAHTPVK